MNTNEKGATGLIEVMRYLNHRGFYSYLPIEDHGPVDLIAMNRQWYPWRLQVKYRKLDPVKQSITIPLDTVINGVRVPINIDAIDGWAIYIPELDDVVFVHKSEVGISVRTFSFRLTSPKKRIRHVLYTEFVGIEKWHTLPQ